MKSNRIVLFVAFISILIYILTNKNTIIEGHSRSSSSGSSSSAGNGGSGGYGGHGGFNGMYGAPGNSYGRGFTNYYEGNSCMT
jgi:hypothetical protein